MATLSEWCKILADWVTFQWKNDILPHLLCPYFLQIVAAFTGRKDILLI